MSFKERLDSLFVKAFTSNPCPMAISEGGKFILVNDALLQALGYLETEVIGKSIKDLGIFADESDHDLAIQLMQKQGYLKNFETGIRSKNKSVMFGLFNAEYIEIGCKTYILTVMYDVSARKLLEQEVIRLERLNLIGELAGGISHEVRNPITTVRGFLQHLATKPQHLQHPEKFELLISELDRATTIINEFLSISKSTPANTKYDRLSLNNTMNKLKPLINSDALEKNHTVKYHLDENCSIIANENEIRQLILNLVRNGFDAMPSRGILTLKTLRQKNHVVLVVQDKGEGINKSILDRLGTPFLTTKDKGTGLGLAVCYGIVHRHDAKINVETGPRGTTFSVHFPILSSLMH